MKRRPTPSGLYPAGKNFTCSIHTRSSVLLPGCKDAAVRGYHNPRTFGKFIFNLVHFDALVSLIRIIHDIWCNFGALSRAIPRENFWKSIFRFGAFWYIRLSYQDNSWQSRGNFGGPLGAPSAPGQYRRENLKSIFSFGAFWHIPLVYQDNSWHSWQFVGPQGPLPPSGRYSREKFENLYSIWCILMHLLVY